MFLCPERWKLHHARCSRKERPIDAYFYRIHRDGEHRSLDFASCGIRRIGPNIRGVGKPRQNAFRCMDANEVLVGERATLDLTWNADCLTDGEGHRQFSVSCV